MSASAGVLDFFVVEATEYIERLDALLASAGASGPDASEFLRYARSLRGSSTMAKQYGISRVAAALEQAARALRTGAVRWDPAVNAIFIAAVENLKILLRNVRAWGATDEQRAQARIAELERLAPAAAARAGASGGPSGAFLVSETATLADALDQLIASPGDQDSARAVLEQVRALRGVAALRDLAPLPDVVDVVERVARDLHRGSPLATSRQLSLVSVAAGVLRRASGEVAAGRRLDAGSPEVQRFHTLLGALGDSHPAERVVPIEQLYHEDAGPHVVQAASAPPTTPAERFRLELVSQAEHVRRVVDQARNAPDAAASDRLAGDLRNALHSLERAATDFGETQVAQLVRGWRERMFAMDVSALSTLDGAAALLTDPATRTDELLRTLRGLDVTARRATTAADPRARFRTPTGQTLVDMLERGITGLDRLSEEPLQEPVAIPQDRVVPVDELLYRGPSALQRALDVRRDIREEIGRAGYPPSEAAVAELLDLLELTVTE